MASLYRQNWVRANSAVIKTIAVHRPIGLLKRISALRKTKTIKATGKRFGLLRIMANDKQNRKSGVGIVCFRGFCGTISQTTKRKLKTK